jgi:hypothetical protein
VTPRPGRRGPGILYESARDTIFLS